MWNHFLINHDSEKQKKKTKQYHIIETNQRFYLQIAAHTVGQPLHNLKIFQMGAMRQSFLRLVSGNVDVKSTRNHI